MFYIPPPPHIANTLSAHHIMKLMVPFLSLLIFVATTECVAGLQFGPYADGSTMNIELAGWSGDTARVTVIPKDADLNFLRYQGYINTTALITNTKFDVQVNDSNYAILARPGWKLNVSKVVPTVSLIIGGVVVSAELGPPTLLSGKECDPAGWKGLAPGIGITVASSGTCLRSVRTLVPVGQMQNDTHTGIRNEQIYGFGQTVTPGLNTIGSTKFIATFSRTLQTGAFDSMLSCTYIMQIKSNVFGL